MRSRFRHTLALVALVAPTLALVALGSLAVSVGADDASAASPLAHAADPCRRVDRLVSAYRPFDPSSRTQVADVLARCGGWMDHDGGPLDEGAAPVDLTISPGTATEAGGTVVVVGALWGGSCACPVSLRANDGVRADDQLRLDPPLAAPVTVQLEPAPGAESGSLTALYLPPGH
jgi:hypothetical protein